MKAPKKELLFSAEDLHLASKIISRILVQLALKDGPKVVLFVLPVVLTRADAALSQVN